MIVQLCLPGSRLLIAGAEFLFLLTTVCFIIIKYSRKDRLARIVLLIFWKRYKTQVMYV